MTNKSIRLLLDMQSKKYNEKEIVAKEILEIEYKRIVAQAKNFLKTCDKDELVEAILEFENSKELFDYLNHLSLIEISLLSSYGIDVAFMNLLKVSE